MDNSVNWYRTEYKGTTVSLDCPFCIKCHSNNTDHKDYIIKEYDGFILVFNRWPYAPGHMMIISKRHVPTICELSTDERNELIDIQSSIVDGIRSQGYDMNIGINVGKDAGASIPDHLHIHIVPRIPKYKGGFMEAVAKTTVIRDAEMQLYSDLRFAFE